MKRPQQTRFARQAAPTRRLAGALLAAAACCSRSTPGGGEIPTNIGPSPVETALPVADAGGPPTRDTAAVEAASTSPPTTGPDTPAVPKTVANPPVAPAGESPSYRRTEGGDLSGLPTEDARFVAAVEPVLDDFHMGAFRYRLDRTQNLGPRDAADFPFAGRILRRVAARGTLHPFSTGALDVTFWKTDDGLYFVRTYGGCVAAWNTLYGPFRARADTFVFDRDARGPEDPPEGPTACADGPGGWCPGRPGDPCGEHRDVASCVADERCVVRPYLDDSLRPCGPLANNCMTPRCGAIGCVSKCNRLTDEATCTAQAPRCAWTDSGCTAPEGDCR